MRQNIKIVAWLNILFGLPTLFLGVYLIFASLLAGGLVTVPLLSDFGGTSIVFCLALAIPSIVAGLGLLQMASWARPVAIVVSFLHFVVTYSFSVSFLLGIFSLVILFDSETRALFAAGHQKT